MMNWLKHPACIVPLTALLVVTGLSFAAHLLEAEVSSFRIERGIIDLSQWNPEQQPSFPLAGEVEFYWNELIISQPKADRSPVLIPYPGPWNNAGNFSGHGFASYRYVVEKRQGQQLSIWPSWLSSASVIYLNGAKVNEGGRVADNSTRHQPGFIRSGAITLPLDREKNEIVIEVSNYDLYLGGQLTKVFAGTDAALTKRYSTTIAMRAMMLGSLIILAVYLTIIYSLRTQDASPLFLGLMCVAMAIQVSLPFTSALDLIDFRSGIQGYNWGWFVNSVAFIYFLRSLYPDETSKYFSRIFALITVFFCVFIAVQPVREFYGFTKNYQIVTALGVVYSAMVLYRAIARQREGAMLLALGAIVVFLATGHDLVVVRGAARTLQVPIVSQAFFFLILCQAYVVSAKTARAYATVEHLSANLKQEVDLRTEEIQLKSQKIEVLHRHLMENVLQRYLPSTLVERILEGSTSFDDAPKATSITIMFVDLCDFTTQTERLGPEIIGKILNSFLTRMSETVFEFGGTIDKFMGDGILILFGAPESMEAEEQVRRGTDCARAMLESLAMLNKDWNEHHLPAFSMRVGIHRGSAIVGSFGGPKRSDYTVIGHTVNLASRIQGIAEPDTVYMSETVSKHLAQDQWETVGLVPLKGVAGVQPIFRLKTVYKAHHAELAPRLAILKSPS